MSGGVRKERGREGYGVRVAVYCRVSTEKEDQLHSLESQKHYFAEFTGRNPDWELYKIYADEGITGTSIKKRHAFLTMLEDAVNHKFDLILTKEISRFARNTLDSIYYSRKLKKLGIGILFVNDNINTLEADSELRLTILSSIAQEESRKTSERVKWGQKRSMERGVVFGRDLLGYDVRGGNLYVNEEGAKVVRLIFHKFVNEHKSVNSIANELNQTGIPTLGFKNNWHGAVIHRILQNEKYSGDLIQKKTYTPDYLNHEKKKNNGEEDFIRIPNHHEPIVSREVFEKAKEELKRRELHPKEKKKYSNRYLFSGKIKCKGCHKSYVSRTKKRKDGSIYRYWRCYEAVLNGKEHRDLEGNLIGCNSRTLREEDLKELLQNIIKNLNLDKEQILSSLENTLKKVKVNGFCVDDKKKTMNRIKQCEEKINRLTELYINEEITKSEYVDFKERYKKELGKLYPMIETDSAEEQDREDDKDFKENLLFLQHILKGCGWSDAFYKGIVEKILVSEDGEIEVFFKYLPFSVLGYSKD